MAQESKKINITPHIFVPGDDSTDFSKMILLPSYKKTLFIFNDNVADRDKNTAGANSAAVRKHNFMDVSDPMRIRSAGVSTGAASGTPWNNAFTSDDLKLEHKAEINKDLGRIVKLLKTGVYNSLIYSAKDVAGHLGFGVFAKKKPEDNGYNEKEISILSKYILSGLKKAVEMSGHSIGKNPSAVAAATVEDFFIPTGSADTEFDSKVAARVAAQAAAEGEARQVLETKEFKRTFGDGALGLSTSVVNTKMEDGKLARTRNVVSVRSGGQAELLGINEGDAIVAVDGKKGKWKTGWNLKETELLKFEEIDDLIRKSPRPVTVTFSRPTKFKITFGDGGLGITYVHPGGVIDPNIQRLVPGGQAEKLGVQQGDAFVNVGGTSIDGMTSDDLKELLALPRPVTIEFSRASAGAGAPAPAAGSATAPTPAATTATTAGSAAAAHSLNGDKTFFKNIKALYDIYNNTSRQSSSAADFSSDGGETRVAEIIQGCGRVAGDQEDSHELFQKLIEKYTEGYSTQVNNIFGIKEQNFDHCASKEMEVPQNTGSPQTTADRIDITTAAAQFNTVEEVLAGAWGKVADYRECPHPQIYYQKTTFTPEKNYALINIKLHKFDDAAYRKAADAGKRYNAPKYREGEIKLDAAPTFSSGSVTYEKFAIIQHTSGDGKTGRGHFIAYISHKGKWYYISDNTLEIWTQDKIDALQKSTIANVIYKKRGARVTDKPPVAISNSVGNTCFYNSLLQVLFNIPEFTELITTAAAAAAEEEEEEGAAGAAPAAAAAEEDE